MFFRWFWKVTLSWRLYKECSQDFRFDLWPLPWRCHWFSWWARWSRLESPDRKQKVQSALCVCVCACVLAAVSGLTTPFSTTSFSLDRVILGSCRKERKSVSRVRTHMMAVNDWFWLDDRLTNGGTASVSLMAAFIMATTCSLVITSCGSKANV